MYMYIYVYICIYLYKKPPTAGASSATDCAAEVSNRLRSMPISIYLYK